MAVVSEDALTDLHRRLIALRDEVDALLDSFEDIIDVLQAEEVLDAIAAGEEETIPWPEAKRQLGL